MAAASAINIYTSLLYYISLEPGLFTHPFIAFYDPILRILLNIVV
jgi:hypothetical protein